jgi:hypothetical protein
MAAFTVARDIRAVVTDHASGASTALLGAEDRVERELRTAAEERVTDVDIRSSTVHENPVAPFEPYRVSVTATLVVTIDASDRDAAADSATVPIEETLSRAHIDSWEFASGPVVEAA